MFPGLRALRSTLGFRLPPASRANKRLSADCGALVSGTGLPYTPPAFHQVCKQTLCRYEKRGYVIDTNVLVSALMSNRGASYKILSLLPTGKFEFHLSVPLVYEYESVLKRSELNLTWTMDEIDELLDIVCLLGVKHEIWYLWRPLLQDAGDEFVAEVAVTAQAEAIVTLNVRDFKEMKKFGIEVLTPKEFLQRIGEVK